MLRYYIPLLLLLTLQGCGTSPVVPSSPTAESDSTKTSLPPVEEVTSVPSVLDRAPASPQVTAPPPVAPEIIEFAAVGDLMLGTDYPDDRLPVDDGRQLLAEVAPILQGADIALGNLEGSLLDGGEAAKRCATPSLCYLFRTPTRFAARFAEAGFDVVSLANNHVRDFGEAGRSSSMRALDAVGIRHSGGLGDIARWRVRGTRVAFIAYAPYPGSHDMLDIAAMQSQVEELARESDVVVVSFHGGAEGAGHTQLPFGRETFYGEDRGDVVQFARRAIDAGADLVIGHGPHVPRALELYRGRLIAYSLGNFATYRGVNIRGVNGIAPILLARLDGEGRLLDGRIVSARQQRPGGTRLDDSHEAARLIRELSQIDFPQQELIFADDGAFLPRSTGPAGADGRVLGP